MAEEQKCDHKDCEIKRVGPFTQANNPEHPEATRKTPMKCEKCGEEWYEYF